ncbi:acetyltransferase [Streptomyces albireticuli]|uniref:Acetyltransferase n=1 Tax=Streptomyces albireticuli TaxID=1940 RepID=A0A1Z2L2F9_9ACTN|nr:GNAT family N-acetyltransferase [Streptomyces albireticuli]ARZ68512.1 acetyltransferase [Streptomyces albireticuli]
MRILTFAEEDVPAELRTRADALREQTWPGAGPHDPALRPVTMLLVSPEGDVPAALDILTKRIAHGGRRYRAAGLSAVVTDAAHQGRGYGRRLVAAAREAIGESGADLGLFTCDRPLRGFYERAGWDVLEGAVLVGGTPRDPFPSDGPGFDKVTMAGFFTERAKRDAGAFRHSRVELYPGEIDRLW